MKKFRISSSVLSDVIQLSVFKDYPKPKGPFLSLQNIKRSAIDFLRSRSLLLIAPTKFQLNRLGENINKLQKLEDALRETGGDRGHIGDIGHRGKGDTVNSFKRLSDFGTLVYPLNLSSQKWVRSVTARRL